MTEIEISVRTTVNPTESREKVETAVRNVLGDIVLEGSDEGRMTVLETAPSSRRGSRTP